MKIPYWLKCKARLKFSDTVKFADGLADPILVIEWVLDELLQLDLVDSKNDMIDTETFTHYEYKYWRALIDKMDDGGMTKMAKIAGVTRSCVYNKFRTFDLMEEYKKRSSEIDLKDND